MILVMFAEDLVLNQVHLHSIGIAQPRQSTAKQYPIKTREHSLYVFFEFTDKLLHGVSPLVGLRIWNIQQRTPSEKRQHSLRLAAMRGRLASPDGILRRIGGA